MKRHSFPLAVAIIPGILGFLLLRNSLADEPAPSNESAAAQAVRKNEEAALAHKTEPAKREIPRVSLEVARDRARLLQEVYQSTLDVMHRRYFHGDRATVPARAMQDVFEDMQRSSHIQARWIAVSLKAMSIDNEPESDFEKQSARKIKAGDKEVETIDKGYYRRAVAVPLSGGCVSCHDGFFRAPTSTAKFAGLVISVPVLEGETIDPPATQE